jgi:hypothetical protein
VAAHGGGREAKTPEVAVQPRSRTRALGRDLRPLALGPRLRHGMCLGVRSTAAGGEREDGYCYGEPTQRLR